ncbi:MAG TPA: NAD(P)-dependent oxidoreductase [Acidobacteriaceae bacterium]|jgi:nucleoside-diphosphate-sugar epimerase
MKILITGGSGFIGSHLKAALCSEHELLTPVEDELNLRNSKQVFSYVTTHQPEIVMHLAAKTEVALSFDDFEDFTRVNYLGTVLLAEANRMHNPKLKQFIMASTMETYGHSANHVSFTEETAQAPMAPYAVAKLACEKYLAYMQYAYKFPFTIFRQTNAYGRVNTDFFVMERILSQMLDGPVVKLGAKEPIRNFLFIDDLINLYRAALGNPKAIGQTFVTGPDNGITIEALSWMCAEALGWSGDIHWNTIPQRPGEIFYLNSNSAKAKRLLDWEPQIDLKTGILMTVDRMRATRTKSAAA